MRLALVVLVACSKSSPPPPAPCVPPQHVGDATHYSDDTNACGFPHVSYPFYAAMSSADWGSGAWCGKCLEVTEPSGRAVLVQVIDLCPACKSGDLDLATPAFARLAPLDTGRIKVTWRQAACAPLLFDMHCP